MYVYSAKNFLNILMKQIVQNFIFSTDIVSNTYSV